MAKYWKSPEGRKYSYAAYALLHGCNPRPELPKGDITNAYVPDVIHAPYERSLIRSHMSIQMNGSSSGAL
nr:hypothetical protein [Tanacetum cinerariifolium]